MKLVYTTKLQRSSAAKSLRKQTRFAGLFQTGFGIKSVILFALLFSLFTIHYSLFTKEVHAQAPCPESLAAKEARDEFNKAAITEDIYDSAIFNNDQILSTTDSLFTLLTGCSLIHPETNRVTVGTGALASTSKLIASLYSHPPASGVQYFALQFQKFNPIQPVYAQGIGFEALSPIQDLWAKLRNAAYVGFVIIFVVIGFMIMFRAKISPQAVATVQDSVPRIIVALILVTFSYALAGLMIDLMFLVLNIAINLLGLGKEANIIFEKSIIGVIFTSWGEVYLTVSKSLIDLIDKIITFPILDKIIAGIGGSILGIIIAIALLFVMVRVFLMLLMSYITIILLTLFAPFFFLIQALPGNNGAREWFKQIGSNVSTFAVVGIMIMLAALLGGIEALGGPKDSPLQGQITKFPLLTGDFATEDIGKLIALGFLLITPTVAQMVKEMIGAKGGPNFAGAVMGGLAAGATAGRQIGGQVALRAPGISTAADYLAAQAERPKLRRQATIYKNIPQGWNIPGLYQKSTPEKKQ